MSTAKKKITAWLIRRSKTPEWLSGEIGCSLSTLGRHLAEPGDRTFFLALSKITGLPLEELLPEKKAAVG